MSERQLYRLIAGKQTGPYPPEKLRPLMADGRISRLDRFSYDGVDWLPADQIPELVGKRDSAGVTSVIEQEKPSGPVAIDAPMTPDADLLAASTDQPKSRRGKLPWLLMLGVAIPALLAATALLLSWGGGLFFKPIDVTDEFAMLADSVEGYEGQKVLVRGVYFPTKTMTVAQSQEVALTFRSESGCLLNGDCAYRLTLVASQEMANALRQQQVADRLTNEQPATVSFTCNERRSVNRSRAYGLVSHMTFSKQIPEKADDEWFLRVDSSGAIREQ